MKQRTGKIQIVLHSKVGAPEINHAFPFRGMWQFCVQLFKAYRRRADKVYVFFDKENI